MFKYTNTMTPKIFENTLPFISNIVGPKYNFARKYLVCFLVAYSLIKQ